MAEIIMYTTKTCPYCVRAKGLLKERGVTQIIEIDVSDDDALRAQMMQKAGGRRTVPQIFINDIHVGGCDDLVALDQQGKLVAML